MSFLENVSNSRRQTLDPSERMAIAVGTNDRLDEPSVVQYRRRSRLYRDGGFGGDGTFRISPRNRSSD